MNEKFYPEYAWILESVARTEYEAHSLRSDLRKFLRKDKISTNEDFEFLELEEIKLLEPILERTDDLYESFYDFFSNGRTRTFPLPRRN